MKKFLKANLFNALTTSVVLLLVFSTITYASGDSSQATGTHGTTTLLWIALILIVAKLSSLVERIGQPGVLGELVAGVVMGNLALLGITVFEPIKIDPYIQFFAEFGVTILLFQVGLESNIQQMKQVGARALMVATVGVVVPFVLGTWVVGPWLMPGLESNAYLFIGAALTATSVGITARVFRDMGKLQTREAQIVLGAAVIDDVMGLIILAVVSAIVTLGAVSVGAVSWIVAKALLFLIGSIVAGQLLAPRLGLFLSKIHTGVAMKFTLAIVFALVYSYIAGVIGLAPIVGAFAAGLVLDPVHFKYFRKPKVAEEMENHTALLGEPKHPILKTVEEISEKHVEDLVAPIGHFFVPIFFVITGMNVKLETMFNPKILGIALGITVIAFIGKYVSGMVAGSNVNKHLVGFGMVPRGEVGLIFATIGISLGVISNEVFSVIVIMVILTTLLTPPILSFLLKRSKSDIAPQEAEIAY